MDQLTIYRSAIISLLNDLAESIQTNGFVELVIIIDDIHDQYQLLFVGWEADRRVLEIALYIRLKGAKVWIEHNALPDRVGELLIAAGIPREQIVLGFQPQELRHLSEFAAA